MSIRAKTLEENCIDDHNFLHLEITATVSTMDKYTICISIAVGYLLLCRILRYRLRDAGPKRYGIDISNRETFTKISLKQSYEIHYDLISLESPFMYDVAAFCAFLRVSIVITFDLTSFKTHFLLTNRRLLYRGYQSYSSLLIK